MALASCASSGPIVPGEVCLEIPFLDGAEGACAHSVTRKARIIPKEEWAKERPKMLMIHAKYWTDIKIKWLEACRIAGPNCNVHVKSIDDIVQALDKILKSIFPNP